MATKTKAKPTKRTAGKSKAAKAPAKAAEAKKPEKLLDAGTFVKFNGYRSNVDADEAVFTEGDVLYIVEHEEAEDGILYGAIKADEVDEFLENGEDNVNGGQVAGVEVTELKGGQLEKAREQYMPVKAMGKLAEMLEEADGDAVEVARDLFGAVQENYFWLGGALAQVLHDGSYLKEYEGEEAFNDFCQAEFGFKASKGRQLARLYKTFSQLPDFDPEQLAGIGWSIAAKLEKYVTPENVEEVIETAKEPEVTQRTVDAIMSEKFVSETGTTPSGRQASRGGPTIMKRTLTYRLDEDGADTVDLALQACMKQNGIENEALALERICSEWAQEHVESTTAQKRIQSKANKAAKAREANSGGKAAAKAPAAKGSAKASPKPRKRTVKTPETAEAEAETA